MAAATATSDDFTLASAIPSGCKAEFSVSGKSLLLSVKDVNHGIIVSIR
ncbi:MAG: hypothetical protein J6T51_06855 [Kiritimatiellae bacterium]|nr:hypothetical protein [Kiritimatiellia bacterium]